MSALMAVPATRTFVRIAGTLTAFMVAGIITFSGALGGLGDTVVSGASSALGATSPAVGATSFGPSGIDLTIPEIGAFATSAGFTGQGLVMAIAIALAESSGNPAATNDDSNGTVDRGLWQINSVHTQFSATCDYEPACAATAAFSISAGGTNWSAWVTYQHGAEIPYLPSAVAFVNGAGATTSTATTSTVQAVALAPKGGTP